MPTKRSNIRINKISQSSKLLDERAVPPGADIISRAVLLAIAAGLLVGGIALGYFLYFYNPIGGQSYTPQIIVPNVSEEEKEEPPQEATSPPPAPEVQKQMIEIGSTPTGYLNVRKGAGTNFAKIGQVKPGESYELVSQSDANGGWFEIKLPDGSKGWVSAQYAKVK